MAEKTGRYDEPSPRPEGIGPGTVLEWQRCPVALLGDLFWTDDGWYAHILTHGAPPIAGVEL